MGKIIDTEGLAFFKEQQDAANEEKFMKSDDFLDSAGIISPDKLPTNFGSDVVVIHVVTKNNRTRIYNDKVDINGNHFAGTTEVRGEVGKIYIDLESGSKDHYVYDAANDDFILLSPEIATAADINAMF